MPEIDHSAIRDSITRARSYWEEKKEIAKAKGLPREEILGLKYRKGQKVKDTVTGEEVEIIGGTREVVTVSGPGGKGT